MNVKVVARQSSDIFLGHNVQLLKRVKLRHGNSMHIRRSHKVVD